jgi:hypothetical protein
VATPLITTVDGRTQVVAPAMKRITAYDLETGDVVWQSAGLTMNPIPSPVLHDGLAILMSGFQGNAKAIRLAGAKGDITGTPAVVWTYMRDTPYVPSLVRRHRLFLKTNNGLLGARRHERHATISCSGSTPCLKSLRGRRRRLRLHRRPRWQDGGAQARQDVRGPGDNALDDGFDASPALVDATSTCEATGFSTVSAELISRHAVQCSASSVTRKN